MNTTLVKGSFVNYVKQKIAFLFLVTNSSTPPLYLGIDVICERPCNILCMFIMLSKFYVMVKIFSISSERPRSLKRDSKISDVMPIFCLESLVSEYHNRLHGTYYPKFHFVITPHISVSNSIIGFLQYRLSDVTKRDHLHNSNYLTRNHSDAHDNNIPYINTLHIKFSKLFDAITDFRSLNWKWLLHTELLNH